MFQNITKKILELSYLGRTFNVQKLTITSISKSASTIVVQTEGEFTKVWRSQSKTGEEPHRFNQTFFLAKQEKNKYLLYLDILRYEDEEEEEEEVDLYEFSFYAKYAENSETAPAPAPAPVVSGKIDR